ncbi:hypothetical protein ACFX2H_010119 [Malus domestica]
MQRGSFYRQKFKCVLNVLHYLYKNQHAMGFRRSKRQFQISKRPTKKKSKRRSLSQKLSLLRNHGPSFVPDLSALVTCNLCTRRSSNFEEASSEIGEESAFPDVSTSVICRVCFAEITGNLSTISGKVECT